MLVSYSGFAQFPLPYCGPITFTNAVEPITLVNFAGINNSSSNLVGVANETTIIAHEDYTALIGNVTAGSSYTITLKGNTSGTYTNRFMVYADWNKDDDFADANEAYTITQTITGSTGIDAIQATQSLLVPPTASVGTTRMRVKKIYETINYADPCLGADYGQFEDYSLTVAPLPTDLPDYANLQFPYTATITQGGSATVYGQIYEAGLTDFAPNINGQAPGILAWVGISPLGSNTNPNTWTNWVPATWNAVYTGNNDEYQANLGAGLIPGTYYYATRFQLNGGAFVYGATNFGFWNGTDKINGVLTVTAAPEPGNDNCGSATALVVDDAYCNGTNTNGTNLGATDSGVSVATCYNYGLNDVWYSFVAPTDTATIDVSTDFLGGTLYDTEVALYSGACGSLTLIDCDNDGGIVTQPNGESYNSLIADSPVTAGETYYVRVAGYSATQFGSFCLKVARNQLLSNQDFNNTNLTHYPNPVKNILNLSYNQEISNLEVYNMLGQKVSATIIKANDAHIDMSNLSKGAYMVRVTSNDQVKTIKVIKE